MSGLVSAAFGLLLKVVSQPVANRARRNDRVVAALKKLHLDGDVPRDFDAIYARTLIEECYGAPEPVLQFFRDEHVRKAFRLSYHGADWSSFNREVEDAIQRNEEAGVFGRLDYNLRNEVDSFRQTFDELVSRSRLPSETRIENKVDQLPGTIVEALREVTPTIAAELARVVTTRGGEELRRQEREPVRAGANATQLLATDVEDWFNVLGYSIERKLPASDEVFVWLVRAPTLPGRFGRTVVYGVAGELSPYHIRKASQAANQLGAEVAWAVARQRVSPAATQLAQDEGNVICYTFDELIDIGVDFEPYIAWLEGQVADRLLEERYVELSCRRDEPTSSEAERSISIYDWRDGGLSEYVQRWLSDPTKEHLSVLGEFGTGKSWFSLHFAWEAAKLWREAKRRRLPRPRLPLVIPLRHYTKAASVRTVISQFFFDDHRIRIDYNIFQHLNRMGRLVLVFDGFDEMAVRVDRDTMVRNFWELAKVVEPGAKVLLSCRTEHFPSDREGRDLLSAKVRAATIDLPYEAPEFEVITIEPLDDQQVSDMLNRREASDDVVRLVLDDEELRELVRRPIMSDLVLEALPEIRAGERVDLARIYLYAACRKMDRDIYEERTFTSRADKLYFLCELSFEMLSTNQLSMNYRLFPDRIRACFGEMVSAEKDLDYWRHDMQSQSLLIRNADGDYSPAHKSLLEFFVAYKFAAELGMLTGEFLAAVQPEEMDTALGQEYRWSEYFIQERRRGKLPSISRFDVEPLEQLARGLGAEVPNAAVFRFLESMTRDISDREHQLVSLVRATGPRSAAEVGFLGGNCLHLLASTGFDFNGANLAGAKLAGLNQSREFSFITDLSGADLSTVDFDATDLRWVNLVNADLTGARFTNNSIIDGSPYADQVVVAESGAVAVVTDRAVMLWRGEDVVGEPECLPIGVYTDSYFPTLVSAGSIVAWSSHESFAFNLSHSGGPVKIGARWMVGVEWNGVPALLTRDDEAQCLKLLDPDSLEPVEEFLELSADGNTLGPVSYSFSSMFGIFGLTGPSPSEDTRRVMRLNDDLTWKQIAILARDGVRRHFCAHGLVWADFGAEGVRVYEPDGRITSQMQIDQSNFLSPSQVAFCEQRGLQIVAHNGRVEAWLVGEDQPTWATHLPIAAEALAMHPDGGSLVIASATGEIARVGIDDCKVLSRVSISEKVVGAKLSESCGLTGQELDALRLSGAVVLHN